MAAIRAHSTYDAVAASYARYAAELHRRFATTLSVSDCEDAVQNALLAAWSAGAASGHTVAELENYVRTAARNAAISQIRELHGEGAARRSFTAYDDELHDTADPEHPEQTLLASAEEAEHRQILLAAYERLPAINKAAIRDRYTLELPVAACAARRSLTRTKFERLFTASVNRLRIILADSHADDCMRARFELDVARDRRAPIDAAACAFAHAHTESCFACKTHSFARKGGLLGTLPLPAAGLMHRLLGRIPGLGSSADRVAAVTTEAPAGAGGGAAATGAGGAVLLGVSAKTAAVGACALITTGACVLGARTLLDPPPAKPKAPRVAKTPDQARPAASVIAAPASTRVTPRPAPVERPARAATPKPRAATMTRTAAVQPPNAPAPAMPTRATTPAPAPAPSTPSLPQPARAPAPSSDFSTEFGP